MESLRIWAPRVKRVEVELVDRDVKLPMVESSPGVFELARAAIDGRYLLCLDGDGRIPDPWAHELEGVSGPCRVVDHAAFPWTDEGFVARPLEDALIYELHVGTFSRAGSFAGVEQELDYLAALGVTHIELMPVAIFSGARGWGYDGVALFAPHPAYGGPAGMKHLVDAAHARGIAVLLDVVYNHLGPIGNYLERLGPFFRRDRESPWGRALNFDGADSDEVRRFFIDNALHWLERYHLDGLRLDAVHAIEDLSATHLLEALRVAVDELSARSGRRLVLIAESDLNDPRVVRTRAEHGYGMDAQWSDDFHHALHVALTGERVGYYADFVNEEGGGAVSLIARALNHGYVYEGQASPFRRRRHGRSLERMPLSRLIGYAQTHDQIGNRALGERLSALVSPEKLKLAATLLFTSPFVPMLFMGEEWGASTPFQFFTSHEDERVAQATREGRQREFLAFGWKPSEVPDPQDSATFARSTLRHEEREGGVHRGLLEYTRALARLRHAESSLRGGSSGDARAHVDQGVLHVCRGHHRVLCNFGTRARVRLHERYELVLCSLEDLVLSEHEIDLPPDAAVILRQVGDVPRKERP